LLAVGCAAACLAGSVGLSADAGSASRLRVTVAHATFSGWVRSGDTPIASARVRLYRAGKRQTAAGAVQLGDARTDAGGRFSIRYMPPRDPDAVLYVVAEGTGPKHGRSPLTLAAVLDPAGSPPEVVVNERTTVATAFATAQFTDGRELGGPSPGLSNAAGTAQNLASLATGDVAPLLKAPPNGPLTSTLRTFNSLANMLAACVQDAGDCPALFAAADPPRGRGPDDTFEAIVNVAQSPWKDVEGLFAASLRSSEYGPALGPGEEPDAWTLALRYQGDGPFGQEMDGPGNVAFDADGNAWITNNYDFSLDPLGQVCGSNKVLKLTPTGGSPPGAPYHGGGLYGAGYGITLDPDGNVWVGNFGFQGATCPLPGPPGPLSMSVSKFAPDGTALSPPDGFRKLDLIDQPQGTVSNRKGDIWVANCSGESITIIPRGEPGKMRNVSGLGSKPFDIAFDARGHGWATINNEPSDGGGANQAGAVVELNANGKVVGDPVGGSDGIWRPMGIATDSRGNVWVSNSGVMDPPCEGTLSDAMIPPPGIGDDGEGNAGAAVTLIRQVGVHRKVTTYARTQTYSRGGLVLPWGIAIDGDDTVWIANFHGQRVSQLCGVRPAACPPGKRTGDPISPESGYGSDALVRNTAVEIDPSGNVWLTNNWILNAEAQTNPGGHEMVVFVGLAAPIRTPLIGPPQKP
jgi:hypothetical protein